MGDVLSPEEIEKMLNAAAGGDDASEPQQTDGGSDVLAEAGLESPFVTGDYLNKDEVDVLGEVANMCMGTSATTMSTLLSRKVDITTPNVSIVNMDMLSNQYPAPLVISVVSYIEGITGDNLLILKEYDVALITNVLLGESTDIDPDSIDLTEIHLSAMNEVMNQMVGSSATSLADILGRLVNISTPQTSRLKLDEDLTISGFTDRSEPFVKIAFKMEIDDLLSSEIMQVMPLQLAKEMVSQIMGDLQESASAPPAQPTAPDMSSQAMYQAPSAAEQAFGSPQAAAPAPQPEPAPQAPMQGGYPPHGGYPPQGAYPPPYGYPPAPGYGYPPYPQQQAPHNVIRENVNVAEAQFPNFSHGEYPPIEGAENIAMILDVPMNVTVELGKTKQKIKDILGYNMGSVIVLDRVAGEAVDILVNGKRIGRGEVVVIEDNYGVRITEINSFSPEELL